MIAAEVLILVNLYIVFLVYKEISFTSPTNEVTAHQCVIRPCSARL
jgi:hypothetical protein